MDLDKVPPYSAAPPVYREGDPPHPIYRLPAEVLAHIFSVLVDPGHRDKTVLSVLHVCRYWRQVAIESRKFWRYAPLAWGLECTKLALERSRPEALFIWHSPNDTRATLHEETRLVLQELPRIQELLLWYMNNFDLPNEEQEQFKTLPILDRYPVPLLQVLDLQFSVRATISESIFTGAAPPKLHTLNLNTCAIRPSNPLFHAPLTHLEIQECEAWLSLNDMVETLRTLPLLESLVYVTDCESGPWIDPDVPSAYPLHFVSLPHLQKLVIRESILTIGPMFEHLAIPLQALVTMNGDYDDAFGDLPPIADELFKVFGAHLTAAFPPHTGFGAASISPFSEHSEGGFAIRGRVPCNMQASPLEQMLARMIDGSARAGPPLPEHFELGVWDAPAHADILARFLAHPAFAHASVLAVSHPRILRKGSEWLTMCRAAARHVAFLQIEGEGNAVKGFVEALDDAVSAEAREFMPSLGLVYLTAVKLQDAVVDRLVGALERRAGLGYMRIGFKIERCDVSASKVDALKGCAGSGGVVWDSAEDAVRQEDARISAMLSNIPFPSDSEMDSGSDDESDVI